MRAAAPGCARWLLLASAGCATVERPGATAPDETAPAGIDARDAGAARAAHVVDPVERVDRPEPVAGTERAARTEPNEAAAAGRCPTGGLIRPEPVPPRRGARYVIDVADYLTHRPVAGVTVRADHHTTCTRHGGCRPTHAHPPAMRSRTAITGDDGRAVLDLPDLAYTIDLPAGAPPGYLDFSSIYDLGARRCHELTRESFAGAPRLAYQVAYLIPTSLLAVTDAEQAAAAAARVPEVRDWLAEHPDAVPTVAGGGAAWRVGYAVDGRLRRAVLVNAFDGSAAVNGRWQ